MSSTSSDRVREALAEAALERAGTGKAKKLAGVRGSPGSYFAMAAVTTFLSLILLRGEHEFAALVLILGTWVTVPVLVFTDRISFNGRVLSRRGLVATLSRLARRREPMIALADVERVEINALRTLRRGGSVRYRYRIEVSGNDIALAFSSGGQNFRDMVRCLLPRIPDAKLDARALELRDHLPSPKAVRMEARQLGIAPPAVLDASDLAARGRKRVHLRDSSEHPTTAEDVERARLLRKAANDLRMAGRLREAAEAFRRALLVLPHEASLIYEYSRLLKSQASALGDSRLRTRSCAALRLAGMRAGDDANLLMRIGENFLEHGKSARARKAFRRALEIDEQTFRAQLGLAETSLSEGKLAHVIHHYSEAECVAPDKATARLSRREADYYSRLNDDEDYLAAELRRMNWLQHVTRIQQFAARVSFASLLVALIGSSINQVVAGVAWALASSSIIAWSTSLVATRLLAPRRRASVP